jgi:hypothetical protein
MSPKHAMAAILPPIQASPYFTIFGSFLQNCLTFGLYYQCNFFSVAFPIFFMLCSNNGLAELAIQHNIEATAAQ